MSEKQKFSALKRKAILEKMTKGSIDLLIIGGGITGAGIALDAVARGLKVALVEKGDFASGTSSRSTKLVHGGLRYLEHLEFGVVHEVGREREIVHKNAPHIVIPEKMILPIIKDGSLGYFTSSVGLMLYDYLAGVKKSEHKRMLSKEQVIEKEPLINSELLESGALYYEYKTDDSRLTIEAMKKAVELGALCVNYAEATDFIYKNDKLIGVNVIDKLSGNVYPITALETVNAAGIWVDKIRKKDNSLKGKKLHHTKGIHIVVSKEKFNLNHAIYFDVGDNRMVFAIPRFNIVYIGTTDTNFTKSLDNPDVTKEDAQYLLDAINRIAPTANLQINDIESVWAGIRPLIHEEGKDPSELSRKDEIFYSDSGLISIAGGKLTGYRVMAKKVVDEIVDRISEETDRKFKKCTTKKIKLSGGEFNFPPEMHYLIEYADAKYDEIKATGISVEDFKNLFYRYGKNIDTLIERAFDYYVEMRNTKKSWLKAEVRYAIFNEMATSLDDYFARRTGKIHFFVKEIPNEVDLVADFMAEFLNWDKEKKQNELANFDKEYKQATESFKK
ncbi:MAG: glycerol-3-phosphate dehydrogenase/oxidase [Bacteroidales bacterium]|nr:glycerol-3-phosphate dehydrogenase/oxidase [Bacteroidales bacterium]